MYFVKLNFTKHSLLRLFERKISEDGVYEIFKNKILVLKRNELIVIGKTYKSRFLTLVINPEKNSLITLWPSNKKEREFYIKKAGGNDAKKN